MSEKIQPLHFQRQALVYVRQSTFFQVRHHQESAHRQYNLRQRAEDLGWSAEQIVVVDEDQGRTGITTHARSGFAQLMSEVALGHVGIVLALETSRLARNNADWQRLVWFCSLTETLLADHEQVYDPSLLDDRMVLGLKGTISELEWHTIRKRMHEAARNKAQRGELEIALPAGLQWEDGRITLTTDKAIVAALRLVFEKFEELGTARQVALALLDAGVRLPRRAAPHSSRIRWVEASAHSVYHILTQPQYAGAYVYGKRRTVRQIEPDGSVRSREVAVQREAWPVCLRDHHLGLIDWDQFERIQHQLRANMTQFTGDTRGPAREGAALLQGLAYCGKCGQRMAVAYTGRDRRFAQFHCRRDRDQRGFKFYCQVLGGRKIETAVVKLFLDAMQPAGLEAALQVVEVLVADYEQVAEHWRQRIERAEYEALRAQERYEAVDARNRLVAAELERRWNEALADVSRLRQESEERLSQAKQRLTKEEQHRVRNLAQDVTRIWNLSTTTNRDRKRLLRAALDRVVILSDERVVKIDVYWKGGEVSELQVPRQRRGDPVVTTDEEVVKLIRDLAEDGLDDTQIARVAGRQGLRTATGLPFNKRRVQSIRSQYGVPCGKKAVQSGEPEYNVQEAARQLSVSAETIYQWLASGLLVGRQAARGAPWRIVLDEQTRQRLAGEEAPEGWVGIKEAARRLGVSKQTVTSWVKQGKLQAVRVSRGRREGWRICVDSTGLERQQPLL
jgi:excisionase family DNA binding protein